MSATATETADDYAPTFTWRKYDSIWSNAVQVVRLVTEDPDITHDLYVGPERAGTKWWAEVEVVGSTLSVKVTGFKTMRGAKVWAEAAARTALGDPESAAAFDALHDANESVRSALRKRQEEELRELRAKQDAERAEVFTPLDDAEVAFESALATKVGYLPRKYRVRA